ncbi:hypothetical protein SFR_1498 [Streptomyces sp. FR-008]|nr:hypothetical protein SFR_1498 [Streptomyces sp. FR-008]
MKRPARGGARAAREAPHLPENANRPPPGGG